MPMTMPIMTCVARPRFPMFCLGAPWVIRFVPEKALPRRTRKPVPSVLALLGPLKQRPELQNVLHALDGEHSVDELLASGGSEHRRHQIARFRDDVFAGHRVLRGASHVPDALAEMRPVDEGHVHDGLPPRHETLELLVVNELYFRALTEHRGILHPC